ncbi:6-phosphofructokinase [Rubrivirga sp. SAORIC476]|uniref:6-phosphofructokinase n=1 Tax=Rubrivirga sp. SAORIC476 TaxID=1961794 RepID=UPI000BA8E494|nr:6-phosphofructokinase [Rubrivirga sp. SAORIC476]PAP74909.1 6-phosphofructokinase [Rubrivirga sp. SAORIC476]
MDLKRIGVFTSGGDSPGMNACIRASVRCALAEGLEVYGIKRGYAGMIDGDFVEMDKQSVSNILQMGGTILKSARSDRFRTPEGRAEAAAKLREVGIDALIAIGGDGTLQGATHLAHEHGIAVVGCPGTIDNDLFGTDETIGFDTALNTALDSIDKIRDTADAHDRLFLVEVMGRDTGFIALACGIGGGAELVLIPEMMTDVVAIKDRILSLMASQSRSSIVVVAEGDELGGAHMIRQALAQDPAFDRIDTRVSVLGHIQRGGSPTARDRVLASRLGAAAVEALMEGHDGVMVGIVNNDLKLTPMRNVWSRKKDVDYDLLQLTELLS